MALQLGQLLCTQMISFVAGGKEAAQLLMLLCTEEVLQGRRRNEINVLITDTFAVLPGTVPLSP